MKPRYPEIFFASVLGISVMAIFVMLWRTSKGLALVSAGLALAFLKAAAR